MMKQPTQTLREPYRRFQQPPQGLERLARELACLHQVERETEPRNDIGLDPPQRPEEMDLQAFGA